ncbi:preprotein translocase subunit YajC [bacterium]|nr:preprotein translocase subunit YajC [bacterium]
MILLNIAFAMSSGGAQAAEQSGGGMMGGLITLGLVFLVFYFLLIRPQQTQQKNLQQMRKNLRSGDRVMTSGGLFGTIESISPESVMLKVADKVRIEVAKSAIATLRGDEKKEGGNKSETKKDKQ